MAGRLISAWFVLMLLGGCAYRLTPPARVADPVTVYVVDYGRHASLALPLPDGTYVAWSWGDWRYFALGKRSLGDGAQALFVSGGATLGRLPLAGIDDAGGDLLPLSVERSRMAALRLRLETRFRRREAEAVTGADGRRFVPDGGGYGLGYTSAQRIADWLRELGVDARGGGPMAAFEVSRRRD